MFYKAPFFLHIVTTVLADLTLRLFIPTKFGVTFVMTPAEPALPPRCLAAAATGATATRGQADVTQESTGIAAAYTMGAAALRIQNNDVDNVGGVVGTNEEITEVSLFLSF